MKGAEEGAYIGSLLENDGTIFDLERRPRRSNGIGCGLGR